MGFIYVRLICKGTCTTLAPLVSSESVCVCVCELSSIVDIVTFFATLTRL